MSCFDGLPGPKGLPRLLWHRCNLWTVSLRARTIFITGASRGIGHAIAMRAAADGANVVIVAKTTEPHPKLPGTIYTAAADVEAAGGKALAVATDIRDEAQVDAAIAAAVDRFGGIDVLVNNASAISLTGTIDTPMKRFDLMHQINTRGTFLCTQKAVPHLAKSANPHVLNISPPLHSTLSPRWFGPHVAYTMAKYGMSLCALGMAEEFRPLGIAVNVAVFSRRLAARFLQDFDHDLRVSQKLSLGMWRDRPLADRVHEHFWSYFGEVF